MQRFFKIAATAALIVTAPAARADVVITDHGIFADCTAAFDFREGPLLDMLDGAFANYDAEAEARLRQTIKNFQKHVADAQAAYDQADDLQKKRIAFTVGKWIVLDVLGGMALDKLPSSVTDGYTSGQIETFKQVVAASNGMKADVAQAITTGNPPDSFLSDQAVSVTLGVLGSYFGPVGSFLTGLAHASVQVAVDYWETQPLKDVAQQDVEIFSKAVLKMQAKSKSAKIAGINAVKNQIDAACGN